MTRSASRTNAGAAMTFILIGQSANKRRAPQCAYGLRLIGAYKYDVITEFADVGCFQLDLLRCGVGHMIFDPRTSEEDGRKVAKVSATYGKPPRHCVEGTIARCVAMAMKPDGHGRWE